VLVFYNEAAGALLGRRYEEIGKVGPDEWGAVFGPFDDEGAPLAYDELPLVVSVRKGRPAHARMKIRSADGSPHEIEVAALPRRTACTSPSPSCIPTPSRGWSASRPPSAPRPRS